MKKYIGTKQVKAEPMNLGEFIEQTGRNPYANSSDMHSNNEEGYIVEYEDSYKSWSPKDVFEKTYKSADTFLDRLYIELEELSDKQDKLNKFFDTAVFKNLPKGKQTLLHDQLGAMFAYSQILIERIRLEESTKIEEDEDYEYSCNSGRALD